MARVGPATARRARRELSKGSRRGSVVDAPSFTVTIGALSCGSSIPDRRRAELRGTHDCSSPWKVGLLRFRHGRRRLLAGATCTVLATCAFGLAGCSGGNTSSPAHTTSTSQAQPTAPPVTSPSSVAPGGSSSSNSNQAPTSSTTPTTGDNLGREPSTGSGVPSGVS